jgi:hypothetical protein
LKNFDPVIEFGDADAAVDWFDLAFLIESAFFYEKEFTAVAFFQVSHQFMVKPTFISFTRFINQIVDAKTS